MTLVTITEAAVLISKSTQTIYRHIKAGKILKNDEGKIDISELRRVYGELKTTNEATDSSEYEHVTTSNIISDTRSMTLQLIEQGSRQAEMMYENEKMHHERMLRLYDLLELKYESQRSPLNIICSRLFKQTPQADPTP